MQKTEIGGVDLIEIKRIETLGEGYLQFFEGNSFQKDFPYEIKRIYYITETPKGICRGGHAHKALKQILFCPYGDITLVLSDTKKRIDIKLDKPNKAVIISKPIWREMRWNIENSVLCVGASEYYDENDYIRDYDQYIEYMKRGK